MSGALTNLYARLGIDQRDGLLPLWIVIVGATAIVNAMQSFASAWAAQRVYNRRGDQVTALAARLFGTWTLTSGVVRLYCATNLHDKTCYDMCLASFVIALAHFSSEFVIYGTCKFTTANVTPLIVASSSLLWMIRARTLFGH